LAASKRDCPGFDNHKMDDCPHPITRWRKTHHAKEAKLHRKLDRLRREKAKAAKKVGPTASPAFCVIPCSSMQNAVRNRVGVLSTLAVWTAIFADCAPSRFPRAEGEGQGGQAPPCARQSSRTRCAGEGRVRASVSRKYLLLLTPAILCSLPHRPQPQAPAHRQSKDAHH
jgi:hypothetical protein